MSISRRRFGATMAAGGVYTAFHQVVGVAAPAEQAPRQQARQELCETSAVELAARLARKQPVGLQIVGRHRDEWGVLQFAHAFEQATRHGGRRPSLID